MAKGPRLGACSLPLLAHPIDLQPPLQLDLDPLEPHRVRIPVDLADEWQQFGFWGARRDLEIRIPVTSEREEHVAAHVESIGNLIQGSRGGVSVAFQPLAHQPVTDADLTRCTRDTPFSAFHFATQPARKLCRHRCHPFGYKGYLTPVTNAPIVVA